MRITRLATTRAYLSDSNAIIDQAWKPSSPRFKPDRESAAVLERLSNLSFYSGPHFLRPPPWSGRFTTWSTRDRNVIRSRGRVFFGSPRTTSRRLRIGGVVIVSPPSSAE